MVFDNSPIFLFPYFHCTFNKIRELELISNFRNFNKIESCKQYFCFFTILNEYKYEYNLSKTC